MNQEIDKTQEFIDRMNGKSANSTNDNKDNESSDAVSGTINACGYICLIGGIILFFAGLTTGSLELSIVSITTAISSVFWFGFARIVKAATIYIDKNKK